MNMYNYIFLLFCLLNSLQEMGQLQALLRIMEEQFCQSPSHIHNVMF